MAKRKNAPKPETQIQRALKAMQQGQFQRAIRQLEKLLPGLDDDHPQADFVHVLMADVCLSTRNIPKAVHHAQKAISLTENNHRAYYLLGFAYSVDQQWPEAETALRQAHTMDPDEPEYYRALGWALFNKGEQEEGLALAKKALELDPTRIHFLTDLAMLYSQLERYDLAVRLARRAMDLNPSDRTANEVLARMEHFKSEFERLGGTYDRPPLPERPSTEAEWRELIAGTDTYNDLIPLWIDLHPQDNLEVINESLQELIELWNSTPRLELGGRSPNQMMNWPAPKDSQD